MTGTPTKTIQLILVGRQHSIRATIKNGGPQAKEEIETGLKLTLLFLANTYTGANFNNPPNQEQKLTIEVCVNFILDMFPMLGIKEIELAFKLAAAGQFEKVNLETYYGKFTVQFLGKVLKSYLKKRNNILATYEHQKELQENKKVKIDLEDRNANTSKHVFDQYEALKEKFLETGDIEELEKNVCSYWGKILVGAGVINFSQEQKQEIVKEAKELTQKEIRKELAQSKNTANQNRAIRTILQDIKDQRQNPSFDLKWKNTYAKLIIIKSIINI